MCPISSSTSQRYDRPLLTQLWGTSVHQMDGDDDDDDDYDDARKLSV
jgi:hypothetical protein